jgi:hypothetical protein
MEGREGGRVQACREYRGGGFKLPGDKRERGIHEGGWDAMETQELRSRWQCMLYNSGRDQRRKGPGQRGTVVATASRASVMRYTRSSWFLSSL